MNIKPIIGIAGILLALSFLGQAGAAGGDDAPAPLPEAGPGQAVAIFAGGCFWCMEPPYDKLEGVSATTSGYTGGSVENPTYRQVSAGGTGHTEAVHVVYDPAKVSYERLLEVFWHNVDPTVSDRQFCDIGSQYRPGIYPLDDAQWAAAQASLAKLRDSKPFPDPIKVEIVRAGPFYAAEQYHQNYYEKNPIRYKFYRHGCGRDQRLSELWGDAAGK
ncbi:MAG: peptide-methionine (S)-S-oxide reductase MsrA [Burkholderiaceae bacterium]